ncbi:hypothetical protein E1A91_D08G220200v1 [Gossypium mustelinum]|uniref:Uncharacterized protein n=1 Tax=Gossypium mustelinum TaxID=34275 RepID=A0A5D2TYL8_GOSMU|nr:hypothetical protein E1A91_D08G220200v1 [Gossypium mustelinum]
MGGGRENFFDTLAAVVDLLPRRPSIVPSTHSVGLSTPRHHFRSTVYLSQLMVVGCRLLTN